MRVRTPISACLLLVLLVCAAPAAAQSSAERSKGAWARQAGRPAASANGARPDVKPRRYQAYKLNRGALQRVLAESPRERARAKPLEISLPDPAGGFTRFALVQTQIMEPGLAAEHPEIATYAGTGIDDPGATLRVSITDLGLQASVRSPAGHWYVDPYYKGQESLYVSYRGEDLEDPHGAFVEREPIPAGATRTLGPLAVDGPNVPLRQYRLAFLTDPTYATYHGAAKVTSAKVALINRVNQIYEDDFGIRLVLVAGNDALNFNTAAMMTGAGGPCGGRACFTSSQASSCDGPTLDRNHTVVGQIIGAGNYDVGHIGMGNTGGGLAYLGVVGRWLKGGGCTGVTQPTGDYFAVDYVAHELGHQFAGNHTFNGTAGNCAGNIAATSVEPGSGSSVMAYAGICGGDDLQSNTDPYFSQQTISEVGDYTSGNVGLQDEYQTVALTGWGAGDSFRLTYNGSQSASITFANYTRTAIDSALEALPGLAGQIVVSDIDEASNNPSVNGFLVRFAGGADRSPLSVTSATGVTGTVSETDRGGVAHNGGSTVTPTSNRAPVATPAGAAFTIPARTPFALTATATDADGDPLTYSWEQNDPAAGKSLLSNTKPNGPLFRQFGKASTAQVNPLTFSPAGQNVAPGTPTRVFPDIAQIAANNTNAAAGTCQAGNVDCFSEFLPTSSYGQPMHFRLTVRDGNPLAGGVGSADTTVNVATAAGPFLVAQPPQSSYPGGSQLPLTWQVAGTSGAPVNAANVRISLSTDGGLTFPNEIVPSTPNDGAETIALPSVQTTTARIKVEAVGNVFFDITNANFSISPAALTAANTVGTVLVGYGDPIWPTKSVSASHSDSNGSALSVSAPALPAGLALTAAATSADGVRPGTRRWDLTGDVTADPGNYPVTATATDGATTAPTAFTVKVEQEILTAHYTSDAAFVGPQGATTASVPLEATLEDTDGGTNDFTRALVTFLENGTGLCSALAGADGVATCDADLGAGDHDLDVVVTGTHYAAIDPGFVSVSFPGLGAVNSGDAEVQYSDTPSVTVTATDEDSPGSALNAQATGLPAGLSVAVLTTGADTRTWQLSGGVSDPPGTYPVTVTVDDGAGHTTQTSFTLTVMHEQAAVYYTGDFAALGEQEATMATVPLEAQVSDSDGSPGDLSTATLTFTENGTLLCGPVAADATGVAGCDAQLGAGDHQIDVEAGGNFAGDGFGDVAVAFPQFTVTASGDGEVQYSDALSTPLNVDAEDELGSGDTLVADPKGLPAGMAAAVGITGGTGRRWTIEGATTAAPGDYPVTFDVSDGDGHTASTAFTIKVKPEDALVADGTDDAVQGTEGQASAPVTMRATLSETADGTAGDLTKATVTFQKGAAVLCTDTAVTALGVAECEAQLPIGTTSFTIEAGGRYTGSGGGSVEVQAPVFSATASADVTVQYSDLPAVTVSASDDNTPGADLVATPTGLPAGLSLAEDSTGAGLPGTRTWRVAGQVTGALGEYPVKVDVTDGAGHTTSTTFKITVTAENAGVAFTGDKSVTGEQGASSTDVSLQATLTDPDGSAEVDSLASVAFKRNGATLCTAAALSAGVATCQATLGAGAHTIDMEVTGRYTGSGSDTVNVSFPAFTLTRGGDASVQYSDPLAAPLTVTATDEDSPGTALTPAPAGLPPGLTPTVTTTGANSRTWRLDGAVTGAPGTYPVTFTVGDGDNHQAATAFTISVTREDAVPTFTGNAAQLSATLAELADGTPGDLAHATLSYFEGDSLLCAAFSCPASFGAGTHAVRMEVGGRYAGQGQTTITVAPAPARPTPLVAPSPVTPKLSLTGIPRTVRVKTGRFKLKLTCLPAGAACSGKLALKAKKVTVATATYVVNGTKTITVKLNTRGRKALRKRLAVKLTAGSATRSFSLRR